MNFLALVILVPGLAQAGSFSSSQAGTSAAQFLRLGSGARATALGDAYSSVVEDATSIYWNPAGLAAIEDSALSVMHASYIDSSALESASFARRMAGGVIGAGLQYFTAGKIAGLDTAGQASGNFTPNDLSIGVGYARKLGWLSAGGAFKLIRSQIVDSAQTFALDFGAQAPVGKRLKLGAAVSNLGGRLKYEQESHPLPLIARLGGAVKLFDPLALTADVIMPKDGSAAFAAGTEYLLLPGRLALRAGMNTSTLGQSGGLSGFCSGLGFMMDRYSIDYAVVPFGSLGLGHRFSLNVRLGGGGNEETAQAPVWFATSQQ